MNTNKLNAKLVFPSISIFIVSILYISIVLAEEFSSEFHDSEFALISEWPDTSQGPNGEWFKEDNTTSHLFWPFYEQARVGGLGWTKKKGIQYEELTHKGDDVVALDWNYSDPNNGDGNIEKLNQMSLKALASGEVIFAGWHEPLTGLTNCDKEDGKLRTELSNTYGQQVIIQLDDNRDFVVRYAHLDSIADGIEKGEHVNYGELIGIVGSSQKKNEESAMSSHLHLVLYQNIDKSEERKIQTADDWCYETKTAKEWLERGAIINRITTGNGSMTQFAAKYELDAKTPASSFIGIYGENCDNGFSECWKTSTSQAFISAYFRNGGEEKLGKPDNGPNENKYVHKWEESFWKKDCLFCEKKEVKGHVWIQDFINESLVTYDHNGKPSYFEADSALILNNADETKAAYLVHKGFWQHYYENDGPAKFGVPKNDEYGGSECPATSCQDFEKGQMRWSSGEDVKFYENDGSTSYREVTLVSTSNVGSPVYRDIGEQLDLVSDNITPEGVQFGGYEEISYSVVVWNNTSTGSFASRRRFTRDGTSNSGGQRYTFKLNDEYVQNGIINLDDLPLPPDPYNWELIEETDSSWGPRSIAYGNEMYVTVGKEGSISYSTDTETWTYISSINTNEMDFYDVAYGNGMWVIVGKEGSGSNKEPCILYSEDNFASLEK